MSAQRNMTGRCLVGFRFGIDHLIRGSANGTLGHLGCVLAARSHQMADVVSPGHQVVSDDPAMAAPPDGFRAHKRHMSIARQIFDLVKGCLELIAERVVCIIVKALDAPISVECGIYRWVLFSPTAEPLEVLVSDIMLGQRLGKRVDIKSRIGAGARECANVRQKINAGSDQHVQDGFGGAVRMPDGEESGH